MMNKIETPYVAYATKYQIKPINNNFKTLCFMYVRMFDSVVVDVVVVEQSEKRKVSCSFKIELKLRWKVLNVP